jgi:hypothetical protein
LEVDTVTVDSKDSFPPEEMSKIFFKPFQQTAKNRSALTLGYPLIVIGILNIENQ